MRVAQSRHKSYANKHGKDLEFEVGDHVFLKVLPVRVVRFEQKSRKLSPCYIGLFKILECVGKVAYNLALPLKMARVHNLFYISMLRKYINGAMYVINFNDIEVNDNITYQE